VAGHQDSHGPLPSVVAGAQIVAFRQ
jgi:hypothetical protein